MKIIQADKLRSDIDETVDICIVGGGLCGLTFASEIADSNLKVCLIEEGSERKEQADLITSFSEYFRNGGLNYTFYAPNIMTPTARCLGGMTALSSFEFTRMSEDTFSDIKRLHELSAFSFEDLTQAYNEIESNFQFSEPLDEESTDFYEKIRRACKIYGCHARSAKLLKCLSKDIFSENPVKLAEFPYYKKVKNSNIQIISGFKVNEFNISGDRVDEVVAISHGERRIKITIRPNKVAVACGPIETPLLLYRSLAKKIHRSLGNNLALNPSGFVLGLFNEDVNWSKDNFPCIDDFLYLDNIEIRFTRLPLPIVAMLLPGFGQEHKNIVDLYSKIAVMYFRIVDDSRGKVLPSPSGRPHIKYKLSTDDSKKLLKAIRICSDLLWKAQAKKIYLPIHGMELIDSKNSLARFDRTKDVAPKLFKLFSLLPYGSCAMGDDEENHAVGPNGRYVGMDNLYIVDESILPESTYVDHTLTKMAFSKLIAKRILANG